MTKFVPIDEMRITVGGTRSFLPQFLDASLADRDVRAFLIPENRGSLAGNNEHFSVCFEAIANHAPFNASDLVFIDRSAEAGAIRPRQAHLEAMAAAAGFPLDRVIYVSQNSKAAITLGRPPRWLFFHHYLISMSRKYRSVGGDFNMSEAGPTILCLNGKVRPHRLAVAAELDRLLHDRAVITWQGNDALYGREAALAEVAALLPSFEHVASGASLPVLDLPGTFGVGSHEDMPREQAIAAFLHFVTESDYAHYSDRFTEKVFKPIVAHRPFIVFGPQGILRKLRALGFQTFAPVIDEAYDDIESPDERLKAVFHALVDLTRQDHRKVLDACRNVCAHNQAHLRHGVEQVIADRLRSDLAAILDPVAVTA